MVTASQRADDAALLRLARQPNLRWEANGAERVPFGLDDVHIAALVDGCGSRLNVPAGPFISARAQSEGVGAKSAARWCEGLPISPRPQITPTLNCFLTQNLPSPILRPSLGDASPSRVLNVR